MSISNPSEPSLREIQRTGQLFTPPAVARWMAQELVHVSALSGSHPLLVVDPACGEGVLLEAASAAFGERATLVGVDVDGDALEVTRAVLDMHGGPATCIHGDALALTYDPEHPTLSRGCADVVIMNPPYIGEKNNRALFEHTAALHPIWKERTTARMDYQYYFLHLALDLLREGGVLAALTTAYWPGATSAARIRSDLEERATVLAWTDFSGQYKMFDDAKGQDNIVLFARKHTAGSLHTEETERITVDLHGRPRGGTQDDLKIQSVTRVLGHGWTPHNKPWQPLAASEHVASLRAVEDIWTPLGELVQDRQGVVSGMDRVTKRHLALLGAEPLPFGAPVFRWTTEELRAQGWWENPVLMRLFEPVLRGLHAHPTAPVLTRPHSDEWILYAHRALKTPPPQQILDYLGALRPILEARREVVFGRIPWWSLHWPRSIDALRTPKLWTARRSKACRFGLDLAGHVVHSDCTCLWVHPSVPAHDVLEGLARLWLTLNLPSVEEAIWASGKRKGSVMEFYSQPLRGLRVPLSYTPQGWCALQGAPDEEQVADLVARLRRGGDLGTKKKRDLQGSLFDLS